MIKWEDIYEVIVAMMPLYVALILGYGSVKWWHLFKLDHCDAINRLVCYFTLPLFTFDYTAQSDPSKWNYKFIAADCISKAIIVAAIALWAICSRKGSYSWYITSYSLSTFTNTLVVGVQLVNPMYGPMGKDLVVQSAIIQSLIWVPILLIILEFRRSRMSILAEVDRRKDSGVQPDEEGHDLEENGDVVQTTRPSTWRLMKLVGLKLARNPNCYACFLGVVWAAIANRFHIQMPSIIDKSVMIMSNAGAGTAMFSMGMFMGVQQKLIACGPGLTIFGMVLRFIAGPAAMVIGSMAVGLHGNFLRASIIQAALPQAIISFSFAKEYGHHADVLSTAVIFGTFVSLPILIAYYAVLRYVQ